MTVPKCQAASAHHGIRSKEMLSAVPCVPGAWSRVIIPYFDFHKEFEQ